jgi:hypothetical protein
LPKPNTRRTASRQSRLQRFEFLVKKQLKQAGMQLRSEQRQLWARRAAERRLEQELRQRADEQVTTEREQERRYRKDFADWCSPLGSALEL